MAKTDKQLQDEVNALRKSLNMAELDFSKLNWSSRQLQDELKTLSTLMAQMSNSLSDMVTHIKELIRGSDNFKNIMDKTQSAVRSIESLTEDLFYHQQGIDKLSSRQLWGNAEQIKQKMKMVAFAIKELEQQKNKLKGSKLFTVEQEKQLKNLKTLIKDQERLIAVTRLESFKAFIQEKTSLLFLFGELFKVAKELDKTFGSISKQINLTYDTTVALAKSLRGLSESATVPVTKLLETYVAIGTSLRSNAELNERDLATFTELREKAGLTNEELIAMQQYTFVSGGFLKDNLDTFLKTAKAAGQANGVILNEKQLLQETSKVNKAILAQFTAMPDSLGRTVAKAAQLGTNLEGVEATAKSLINFEESISKELEAQALTGRASNLDAARFYALTNQTEKLTEEIAKHFVTIGEWNSMTRIGQEAYAASLGKSREEMAQMVFEATSLAGLSEEQARLAKDGYAELVKQYGVQRATEMVQEGSVDALIKQQGIQERFNNAVQTLKETLVLLVEGPLGTFFKIITTMLEQTTAMKFLFLSIATISLGSMLRTVPLLMHRLRLTTLIAAAEAKAARSRMMGGSQFAGGSFSAGKNILGSTTGSLMFSVGRFMPYIGAALAAAGIASLIYGLFKGDSGDSSEGGDGGGRAFNDVELGPIGGTERSRMLVDRPSGRTIGTFSNRDTIKAEMYPQNGMKEVVTAINQLTRQVSQPTQVFLNNERVTDKVNLSNFTRSYQVGLSG